MTNELHEDFLKNLRGEMSLNDVRLKHGIPFWKGKKEHSPINMLFEEWQKTLPKVEVPEHVGLETNLGSKQEPYYDHEWKYGTFIPSYKYEDVIKEI